MKKYINSRAYVVCDIDGTIADISHRLHHIEGEEKDWDSFYADCEFDKPKKDIIRIVHELRSTGKKILFSTGRSEQCYEKTMKWLHKHFGDFEEILMRKEGDYRKDYIVKLEEFKKAGYKKTEIFCVFEDRIGVVDAWRELGVPVLQVADGDF